EARLDPEILAARHQRLVDVLEVRVGEPLVVAVRIDGGDVAGARPPQRLRMQRQGGEREAGGGQCHTNGASRDHRVPLLKVLDFAWNSSGRIIPATMTE